MATHSFAQAKAYSEPEWSSRSSSLALRRQERVSAYPYPGGGGGGGVAHRRPRTSLADRPPRPHSFTGCRSGCPSLSALRDGHSSRTAASQPMGCRMKARMKARARNPTVARRFPFSLLHRGVIPGKLSVYPPKGLGPLPAVYPLRSRSSSSLVAIPPRTGVAHAIPASCRPAVLLAGYRRYGRPYRPTTRL